MLPKLDVSFKLWKLSGMEGYKGQYCDLIFVIM